QIINQEQANSFGAHALRTALLRCSRPASGASTSLATSTDDEARRRTRPCAGNRAGDKSRLRSTTTNKHSIRSLAPRDCRRWRHKFGRQSWPQRHKRPDLSGHDVERRPVHGDGWLLATRNSSDANSDTYSDPCANTNAHSDANTNANARSDTDANYNAHAIAHARECSAVQLFELQCR